MRYDNREDDSGLVLPTQETGDRTDAVLQLGYDPRARWSAYGFVQDTVAKSDTREDSGRVGVGGSYMVSDKLRMDAEVSGGDLGAGGKLGTSYMHSERTNLYLNYALEDERTDNALRSTRGGDGSLVTGMKTRFSDSASVYVEERYQHGNSLTGLTHATGVNLAPNERLNLSATTDFGTLTDAMTGAETDRIAGGVRLGYGFDTVQLSTGVEYRDDESQQLDDSVAKRETWLYRNTFRWQITDASRLLGKVNYATSTSSLGNFYDGEYTEAVLGYLSKASSRYVIGSDPFEIERLVMRMFREDFERSDAVVMTGIALIEIACWDIIGKALGQPVYRLLGVQQLCLTPSPTSGNRKWRL